jgi:DNA polymerase III alpha subunit
LYRSYEPLIKSKGWRKLSELDDKKRVIAFGAIEKITPTNSKSGNPRFDVRITDGLDTMTFMVFMSSMQYFRDNCKEGYVVAVPLDKFEDGDRRFLDEKVKIEVVAKQKPPAPPRGSAAV